MNDDEIALLCRYYNLIEIPIDQLTTVIRKELAFSEKQLNESNAMLRDKGFIEAIVYNAPKRKLKYKITDTGIEAYLRLEVTLPTINPKIYHNVINKSILQKGTSFGPVKKLFIDNKKEIIFLVLSGLLAWITHKIGCT